MSSLHPGVTFYEEDRGAGQFTIRIGGTNEFVSRLTLKTRGLGQTEALKLWRAGNIQKR